MKKYIRNKGLKNSDEAWLVVDKDQWTNQQLEKLYQWSQSAGNYSMAVSSNPKFELWMLLHFEDGNAVTNSQNCTERLKQYLPNYDKGHVEINKLQLGIQEAIRRAKQKDHPPCVDWPRRTGSTVYKLVEKLLNTEN